MVSMIVNPLCIFFASFHICFWSKVIFVSNSESKRHVRKLEKLVDTFANISIIVSNFGSCNTERCRQLPNGLENGWRLFWHSNSILFSLSHKFRWSPVNVCTKLHKALTVLRMNLELNEFIDHYYRVIKFCWHF